MGPLKKKNPERVIEAAKKVMVCLAKMEMTTKSVARC